MGKQVQCEVDEATRKLFLELHLLYACVFTKYVFVCVCVCECGHVYITVHAWKSGEFVMSILATHPVCNKVSVCFPTVDISLAGP